MINPPPIQESPIAEEKRSFPQVWLRWFTLVKENINSLLSRVEALESATVSVDDEYFIAQAINEVQALYGETVSVDSKAKSLIKFGRNANVGTSPATIMEQEGAEVHETYVSANSIIYVITDDASFTGDVTIEGHTIDGDDLTFVSQTVTLNGHNAVTLSTPIARVTRLYIPNGDSLSATTNKIYVYENDTTTSGVPDTDSKIHIQLSGRYNQSQKCSTSISKDDYFFVTKVYAGALKKTTATVDVELQVRSIGSDNFLTKFELPTTNGQYFQIDAPPILIIPKNSDVRLVATSTAASTEVVGGLVGYLASIQ